MISMFVKVLFFIIVALIYAHNVNCYAAVTGETALVGGKLIFGDDRKPIKNSVIVISGDSITCLGTRQKCDVSAVQNHIDVSGKYITPGLIDSHVHFDQTGWLDGRPDGGIGHGSHYDYVSLQKELAKSVAHLHRTWLCTGITTVFDVGGHKWTIQHPEILKRADDRVTAITVGPLITHIDRESIGSPEFANFLPMDNDDEALNSIKTLKTLGSDTVKVLYLNPPAARKIEFNQRLLMVGEAVRASGMKLIVHATELENAKLALRAGARILVHSVQDKPVDEEFIHLLTTNGAYYTPTLQTYRNWRRAVASVVFGISMTVDDPNRCIDQKTMNLLNDAQALQDTLTPKQRDVGKYIRRLENSGEKKITLLHNLKSVYQAGGKIVVGTDSGNPLTMHGPSIYEEMELMHSAGIPAADVIKMATLNPSKMLEIDDEIGTIDEGKLADLIILNQDPTKSVKAFRSITHVMKRGILRPIGYFARKQD